MSPLTASSPSPSLVEDNDVFGFTDSFVETLLESRTKLDGFVEQQKLEAHNAAEEHAQVVFQSQSAIHTSTEQLLAIQTELGTSSSSSNGGGGGDDANEPTQNDTETDEEGGIAKRKEILRETKSALEQDIDSLQNKLQHQEVHLQELEKQETKEQTRAGNVRQAKQQVQETKQTTVDDLTRGVVNYKYLGLDFEKAQGSRLRFTFTQLDAGEPLRPFSFSLNVNESDSYVVEDCQPSIDSTTLIKLVDQLNESNDTSPFVRGMRNAFSETI